MNIGRYRILRLLGEGGMGVVYEAEQDQPRRSVALKVIKSAWASPGLLRRFELESQALARLQHPAIAQIFDAGTAEAGEGSQPYFAMEYIANGIPLTAYADAHHLSTRQRLEMFAAVCDGVHHAHQRGIIHRDLKPANILIDENGQPKILDFGVARIIEDDVYATRQTDAGQLIGTLAYMSPEQALAEHYEVDVRSDVYALGVVLHELLAGKLPYTLSPHLLEAVATIRDQDPAPLSTIDRAYRGDIETIVAKALEKQKDRRYASAAELAADIRRFLRDEPILARPASAAYQLRKFARRHTALVVGSAAVFVVLVAGIAATSWQAVKASREAAATRRLNEFLVDTFSLADPRARAAPDDVNRSNITLAEALERSVTKLDAGYFRDQPLVDANVRMTVAETLLHLANPAPAEQQFRAALSLRRRHLPADHPDIAATLHSLAELLRTGRRYAEAETVTTEYRAMSERLFGVNSDDYVEGINDLGLIYMETGRLPLAEQMFRDEIRINRARGRTSATSLVNLAAVMMRSGRAQEAEPLAREALAERRRQFGDENLGVSGSFIQMSNILRALNRPEEAEQNARRALAIRRKLFGLDQGSLTAVVATLVAQHKYAEIDALYRDLIEENRPNARLAASVHRMLIDWAALVLDQKRGRDAEAIARDAVTAAKAAFSEGDWRYADTQGLVGTTLVQQRRFAEAEAILLTSERSLESNKETPAAARRTARQRLVALYTAWPGKSAEAGRWKDASDR